MFCFYLGTILQRHMLKQLNGCTVEAQLRFKEPTAELIGSTVVTSSLTSSSSLIWTQEHRLHSRCAAHPGSGLAAFATCKKRYDLERDRRMAESGTLHFNPFFPQMNVSHFRRFAACLNPFSTFCRHPAGLDSFSAVTVFHFKVTLTI